MHELLLFSIFAADLSGTDAKIFARVMIIESFIIEGFSNIEHIRLDVGEINALIAPNGYGKSNVLSAISFGLMYLADYSVMDVQNLCSMAMNANGQRARFLAMCFRSG